MGLPTALAAHKQGDLQKAADHYQRALNQKSYTEILFQNYGSLLRDAAQHDKARKVYEMGLKLYPNHEGIRSNYANFICHDQPWKAFSIHLDILREISLDSSRKLTPRSIIPILIHLERFQLLDWAYQVCKYALYLFGPDPSLLIQLYKIGTHVDNNFLSTEQKSFLEKLIEPHVQSLSVIDKAEYYYALAWIKIERHETSCARTYLKTARDLLNGATFSDAEDIDRACSLNNNNSWNMACVLLTYGEFNEGWMLFDYGLCAKSKGPQKWQRALPKPFTHANLKIWRGEPLNNKRLLILEEQAVGDVIQFLLLLPYLLTESSHIGIVINDRLYPIYKRTYNKYLKNGSLTLWSFEDIANNRLMPNGYDFQIPLGSICQHRISLLTKLHNQEHCLSVDIQKTNFLRNKYFDVGASSKKLIGVSWRGGGQGDRIKQKSIKENEFALLLRDIPNTRFVSLQYGESESVVKKWQDSGIDIINDNTINSLKDMDSWLSQVAACDAVLSVANTTIHGAGALQIPTLCLLGYTIDWRWLRNSQINRSYWYKSVMIARQDVSLSWAIAFDNARSWMMNGTPLPEGPAFIP